ncbi:MAG TPA: autotransporter-associated beta strand repeat-containing protein, partial [Urbifossiella sp.]|nr:autotransporter-associated beta strand repeat-containing protein [Urbifossiella sp.]
YDITETVVASGATLQLAGSVAQHEGGVAAGVHVQDERLTLNQYGVQIRIAGQPTARFTLNFAGQPTDVLQVPSGYTGAPGTYAAYLQNQINTKLTNIAFTLTNGVPGASPADAAATVTELSPGVFSITFGAARFNNFLFGAFSAFELPINLPTITSKAEVRISGSNAPLIALSDDNTWRGPVTLNSGTRIEVRSNSRLALLGDIVEGALPTAPGSDLVKLNGGDLTLGGAASTYRGTTYIDEGIVTAVSSRAFGAPSTGPYDPNLGAAPGGTEVRNRAQLQLQGSLTIAGEGLAVQGEGTPTLPTLDSSLRWLNVGPGATNNGVSAPFTGTGGPTSGRINSIATDPSDPRVIYVTTAGAGAWKSKDGGLTWIALFDQAVNAAGTTLGLSPDTTAGSVAAPLPRSAMMFGGSIAVAPSNPQVVYYATGDSNGVTNGIPNSNLNAVDNYAGSGVYKSTDGGKTWVRLLANNGTNPLYGQAVTKLIIDPFFENRIYVASGVARAGTPNLNNASQNAVAGVWRYTNDPGNPLVGTEGWVNLVAASSAGRNTVGQAPFDAAGGGGPANPGPDDHFQIRFPNGRAANPADATAEPATWSDIALVLRHENGVNSQYMLIAALGESSVTGALPATPGRNDQVVRTGVYFTENPDKIGAGTPGQGVAWWHGKGTLYPTAPDVVALTSDVDKRPTDGFPLGALNVNQQRNGYIKLTAATQANSAGPATASGTGTGPRGLSTRGSYPITAIFASIAKPGFSPETDHHEFLEIQRSYNAGTLDAPGWTWQAASAGATNLATAFGDAIPNGVRPALGRYDHVIQIQDSNPQSTADNTIANLNEVVLGGVDSIFRTVNSLAPANTVTWPAVAPDDRGFAPAEQFHALHYDAAGRLLTGSDGGLWRWDRLRFSNLNSNLSAVQFNSVDPHPTDFRQAVGGASDTGTQVWNGYDSPDGLSGPSWRRVDDLSTTVVSPPTTSGVTTGSVSGVVRYDPFDPRNIYAVRDGRLKKSTNGGVSWTEINPLPATGYPSLAGVNGFTAGDNLSFFTNSSAGYDQFPLVIDPLTPNRLVIGGQTRNGNVVLESTDGGVTWSDLFTGLEPLRAPVGTFTSRLAAAVLPADGGPFGTPRVIGLAGYQGDFEPDSRFPTVTEGLTNTKDPRTLYVSDGRFLVVTKNRGVSYVNTQFPLPAGGVITDIVVNPVNRDEVYVTVSARPGAVGGRIWRSIEAGRPGTWVDLTGSVDPDAIAGNDVGPLPNIPTWKAAIDPRTGTLYVGNDNGVWVLVDSGATDPANVARTAVPGAAGAMHWRRVGDGMPNVQVRDLVLNQTNNVLTAGTHGRGMFQLFLPDYDDVSGAVRAVSGQSQWTGPVVLTGNTTIGAVGTQQIQNGLSAASVDFGGTISSLDNGPTPDFTLTKIGRGTVILSGANTYLGVTDVREGVLEVKDPNALGSEVGNTVVRYGAALQVRSDIELEPITINGDGIAFDGHFTGALRNISGNNTYNGLLTLGTETSSTPPLPIDLEPNQVTIGVDSGSSLKIGQNPAGQNPGRTGHVEGATAAMGFNKELPGVLILSSDNIAAPADPLTGDPARLAYLGLTQVYTGAVEVRAGQALGPVGGSAPTRVSDGAAVRIANTTDGPNAFKPTVVQGESLFLSGTGTPDGPGGVGTGALRNTGGNNTWNGPIQLTDIPNFAPTTNPAHQVAFGVNSAADILSVGPTAGIT